MGRPRNASSERIIESFITKYRERFGEDFHPDYGMLVSAGKISKYYNMNQIDLALDRYFDLGYEKFYGFLNMIDDITRSIESDKEMLERSMRLEKDTTKFLRRILKKDRA